MKHRNILLGLVALASVTTAHGADPKYESSKFVPFRLPGPFLNWSCTMTQFQKKDDDCDFITAAHCIRDSYGAAFIAALLDGSDIKICKADNGVGAEIKLVVPEKKGPDLSKTKEITVKAILPKEVAKNYLAGPDKPDFAIIRASCKDLADYPTYALAEKVMTYGGKAVAYLPVSHPADLKKTLTSLTTDSNIHVSGGNKLFDSKVKSTHGDSGSPVFDENEKELIGVISGGEGEDLRVSCAHTTVKPTKGIEKVDRAKWYVEPKSSVAGVLKNLDCSKKLKNEINCGQEGDLLECALEGEDEEGPSCAPMPSADPDADPEPSPEPTWPEPTAVPIPSPYWFW